MNPFRHVVMAHQSIPLPFFFILFPFFLPIRRRRCSSHIPFFLETCHFVINAATWKGFLGIQEAVRKGRVGGETLEEVVFLGEQFRTPGLDFITLF
uniref:Uncharacterized protein n=1 Tax=Caenorhabditis tropicalis TaxID=1561998 RepID=A0A1I7UCA7_9PELO